MPKRIVSRCIGFASTVGFTAIVTGHPSLEQKKANILAGAAAVFTGEKIIDSITTSSSFKPTPLEDTFLQSSKIIDVNRNLAPPDTNIVSDRITHVLNNVSSLIDSEKILYAIILMTKNNSVLYIINSFALLLNKDQLI